MGLENPSTWGLAGLIFAAALLYSSVGHGGASGYLAAMAFFGLDPMVMKPTALVLNILVASMVMVKLYRAGWFSWSVFWPFALASVPFAFLGGTLALPSVLYKPLVGAMLCYAACRLLLMRSADLGTPKPLAQPIALALGGIIGLFSGMTGVGGGIFLSPLLLLMGWASPRTTAGVAAAFITVNSMAGLLGHWARVSSIPSGIPLWAIAALSGGYLGVEYGGKRFENLALNRLLAIVLAIAGVKMALSH